jgi:hypothetical protein
LGNALRGAQGNKLKALEAGEIHMPAPLALTDSQITTIMALASPLPRAQRGVFLEMVAAKLNERCNGDVGDGDLHRLCHEVQRSLFSPPLETERHEPTFARSGTGESRALVARLFSGLLWRRHR